MRLHRIHLFLNLFSYIRSLCWNIFPSIAREEFLGCRRAITLFSRVFGRYIICTKNTSQNAITPYTCFPELLFINYWVCRIVQTSLFLSHVNSFSGPVQQLFYFSRFFFGRYIFCCHRNVCRIIEWIQSNSLWEDFHMVVFYI